MGTINLQIPQSGVANSTEDPKIASDFTAVQTLLNGQLDTSNLSPTAGITLNQLAVLVQQAMFSPGDLKPTAAAAASTGWLLCQGQPVSRTTYGALFAVIGTTFGAGDGTNTFNLPDLQGRTIIGAGSGAGLTVRALGVGAGVEAHAHTTSTNDHTHVLNNAGGASISQTDDLGVVFYTDFDTGPNYQPQRTYGTGSSSGWGVWPPGNPKASTPLVGTTAGTGGGAIAGATNSQGTMPPFTVLNWLIKT